MRLFEECFQHFQRWIMLREEVARKFSMTSNVRKVSLPVNVFTNLTRIFHLKKLLPCFLLPLRWCYKHFLFNFFLCFAENERNVSKLLDFSFTSMFSLFFFCLNIFSASWYLLSCREDVYGETTKAIGGRFTFKR